MSYRNHRARCENRCAGLVSMVMCIAVVVFAATPPAANGQSTETEPNNVFIERNLFGPAVSQVDGFLDFGGDVDFLSFTDRQPGSPFTAEIISADFDTILGEFDDGGFLLGMDDDGGVGLLSRLDGTIAPSGDLNLAVSGFNDFGFTGSHGQSGNYSLALTSTTTGGGIAATFTNVDNRVGGPGSPANTILTFDHPGGPALNGIGFSGTLNNLGSGTFPADAQILITSPFGFDTIFQPSDQGGSFASPLNLTGTINDFDGIDPAGTWTFEFWDNFDDFGGGDGGLIDSRWDTVSFDFGGSAPPPASPKFFWIGGSSGLSIQDPANWIDESSNPGVPGPTDTAVFNQDFGFTVFANAFSPTTIGGLEVTSPDRHILRLNAPLTVEGEVVIDKQGTAPLQIEGPASLSASLVRVFSGIFEVDSTSLQVLSSGFTDDDTGILQIGDAVAPGDFTRVEIFPGASVTVERQVQIGRSGNGELLIRSGANLTVDSSFVGDNSHGNVFVGIGDPGGNGQLFVQGDLTSAAQINLGRSEGTSGTMTIGSTGTVQSGKAGSPTGSSGIIGSLGPGTVLVDGGFWTQDGALSVGFGDVGEMTIQDGGFVESLEGFIGRNPGSQGSVLIDGADGDFWHVIESLYVGGNADGAAGTVARRRSGPVVGQLGHRSGRRRRHNPRQLCESRPGSPGHIAGCVVRRRRFHAGSGRLTSHRTCRLDPRDPARRTPRQRYRRAGRIDRNRADRRIRAPRRRQFHNNGIRYADRRRIRV